MFEIERIDHVLITIPPTTRADAKRFYTETLGLKEIPGDHPSGALWIQVGDIELHIREEDLHQTNSARHSAFVVKDLESTKTFLLQKKIEKWFSEIHPDKWVPLYSRVTFSHQPYAEALAVGDRQNEIMKEILAIENIEQIWETEPIEQQILALLKQ